MPGDIKRRVTALERKHGGPAEACACPTTGHGAGMIITTEPEGARGFSSIEEEVDPPTHCRICGRERPQLTIVYTDTWPPDRVAGPGDVVMHWPEERGGAGVDDD